MKLEHRVPGHTQPLVCAAASTHAPLVASGSEDASLCVYDAARLGEGSGCISYQATLSTEPEVAVTSITFQPGSPHVLYAAAGTSIVCVDTRSPEPAFNRSYNHDEINQVAINHKGAYLAAVDDAGDVMVVDLKAGNKLFKALKGAHSNIATSVAFRSHRPWELLTAGMDMTVARWDFSRGKCLDRWKVGTPSTTADGDSPGSENQLFNPPLVHALAVPSSTARPWCSLTAIARGDGIVSTWDGDSAAGPGVQPLNAVPGKSAAASSSSSSSSKKGVAPKAGKGVASSSGAGQGSGTTSASAPGTWLGAWDAGRSVGGHTRPASTLCFTQLPGSEASGGDGPSHVVSGGEDRQILVWHLRHTAQPTASPSCQKAASQDVSGASITGSDAAAGQVEGEGVAGAGTSSGPEAEDQAGGQSAGLLHSHVKHKFKVNQLCSLLDISTGKALLFVADTSKQLACYSF